MQLAPTAPTTTAPSSVADPIRDYVVRVVAEHGVTGAARELGITRESVARIVGGLVVRRGTLALVAQRLSASKPRKSQPPTAA